GATYTVSFWPARSMAPWMVHEVAGVAQSLASFPPGAAYQSAAPAVAHQAPVTNASHSQRPRQRRSAPAFGEAEPSVQERMSFRMTRSSRSRWKREKNPANRLRHGFRARIAAGGCRFCDGLLT